MVAKGASLNDVSSSASVVRKLERILRLLRRDCRALDATSWRRRMSGNFGPLRMWSRMSSERATGLDWEAWIFQDVRESVCWARRRPLGDMVMRVAQRYGYPAMASVVEGRKSTAESVSVEEHR